MTPQTKQLYEAAKAVLYGWASRLTRPRSEWNEKLQALADAISAYEQEQPCTNFEQSNNSTSATICKHCGKEKYAHYCGESIEQPEAITWKKNAYESALDYLSEMGYGSGTNFTSKGVASLLADFASQQTASKDKQLNVQQSHIDEQDQLIFEQAEEIKELKEAISELIQVKDWKDKYGKDEHYLKAMPIAWENARKLIQK